MNEKNEKKWNAAQAYSFEAVKSAGDNVLKTCAGYLLRLAALSPKCTRRDDRRASIPLATAVHCALWRAATAWTAALPRDTNKAQWDAAVAALIEAAKVAACERAEKARQARAEKRAEAKAKAEEAKCEGNEANGEEEDPRLVITLSTATLIAAVWKLPLEERAPAARKVCAEIMSRFE